MSLPLIAASSAVGVAVLPVLGGDGGAVVITLGAGGLLAAVVGLFVDRQGMVAFAGVLFSIQLTMSLGAAQEWWTVGWAVLLLVFLDSAAGVSERRRRLPGAFGPQLWRLVRLAAVAAATAGAVLVLAGSSIERGLLVQAAGLGAAAALVLTVALLAREAK